MWRMLGWLVWLVLVGLLLAALLGSSLYMDRAGIVVPGVVTAKNEHINRNHRSLSWFRSTTVMVRYTPPDLGWEHEARLQVDLATYDQLRVGSAVDVRLHPEAWGRLLPFGVRLGHQTTASMLALINPSVLLPVLFLLLALAAAALFRRTRMRLGRAVLGSLAAVFGVAAVIGLVQPKLLAERGQATATASATVRSVELITKDSSRSRRARGNDELLKPFERVQLALDVSRDGTTVIAVDDIDAGSVLDLRPGRVVPVTYPLAEPRAARIEGATRSHRVVNWLGLPLSLALLGLIAGGIWVIRAMWRRAARRAREQAGYARR